MYLPLAMNPKQRAHKPPSPQACPERSRRAPAWGNTRPRRRIKGSKKAHAGYLFISGSVHRRIPIFRYEIPHKIFLQALEAYRRKYGFRLHAYALMPDHYHLLLWFPSDRKLVDFLRDFKSLVGKQVVEWLQTEKLTRLLARFRLKSTPRRQKDARYCILQYNSHVKALSGSRALRRTIGYIHLNPVRERLAAAPEGYAYSSARAYTSKGSSVVKTDRLELPYD
ncbi:MAG: transposase [Terriglobia bacterium]